MILRRRHNRLIDEDLAVFLHMDDVRVVVRDAHDGGVVSGKARESDIEHAGRVLHARDLHGGPVCIGADRLEIGLCHLSDHLQLRFRVPGDDAGGNRGGNALHAARAGHDNALDILQNVAAHLGSDPLRRAAERIAQLRRGVGDRNGLGTARGEDKLFLQNRHIGIHGFRLHDGSSLSL